MKLRGIGMAKNGMLAKAEIVGKLQSVPRCISGADGSKSLLIKLIVEHYPDEDSWCNPISVFRVVVGGVSEIVLNELELNAGDMMKVVSEIRSHRVPVKQDDESIKAIDSPRFYAVSIQKIS